jgi:chromate transporter
LSASADRARTLRELALFFLRLGFTAFGGPAAHVAMMEDEVVRRRGWLSREEFLDRLSAANLIPGPTSTELAIHIGLQRGGVLGLLLGGACFILPAALLVGILAWAYVRFGSLPALAGVLQGVKPVVIAIVLQALVGFGKTALKSWTAVALALLAAVATALGAEPLLVLLATGLASLAVRAARRPPAAAGLAGLPGLPGLGALAPAAAGAGAAFTLGGLFLVFLKIGAVLFGSGYVLLAFLRTDLVERLGWLTEAQLLDAVAVGQVTPGPVFTTATFVGYVLGGAAGAAVATVAIFLPAFVLVGLSGPLVPRLRRSPLAGAFLDGVNLASLALMAVVTAQFAAGALRLPAGAAATPLGWAAALLPAVALFAASAVLLLRYRVNSSWLVLGGAAIGAALSLAP